MEIQGNYNPKEAARIEMILIQDLLNQGVQLFNVAVTVPKKWGKENIKHRVEVERIKSNLRGCAQAK